jgi:hypothetical protein
MADKAHLSMVVVWEDELKVAAATLANLNAILEDKTSTQEAIDVCLKAALESCMIALNGVDAASYVMLGHGDRVKLVPRDIRIVRKDASNG